MIETRGDFSIQRKRVNHGDGEIWVYQIIQEVGGKMHLITEHCTFAEARTDAITRSARLKKP